MYFMRDIMIIFKKIFLKNNNMKKCFLFFGAAMMLALASCKGGDPVVDYIPFQEEDDGDWGLINAKGEVLYSEEFKNRPSIVMEGCFYLEEKDGSYSIYNATEKTPTMVLDDLKQVGLCSEGVIPTVKRNGRITYVNSKGEDQFTLEPYNGWEIWETGALFIDGLNYIKAEKDGEWKMGIINAKGEVVVEPKYKQLCLLKDGMAITYTEDKSEAAGNNKIRLDLINAKGEEVAKFKYKGDGYPDLVIGPGDCFAFYDGERYYIIKNADGSEAYKCKTDEIVEHVSSKYFVYKEKDGKRGVKTIEGEVVFKGGFDEIINVNDVFFFAARDNEKGYWYDTKGERVDTEKEMQRLKALYGYIIVKKDGEYMLLNSNREVVSKEYDYIYTPWTQKLYNSLNLPVESDYFDAKDCLSRELRGLTSKGYNVDLGITAKEMAKTYTELESGHYTSSCCEFDDVEYCFDGSIKEGYYENKYDSYWGMTFEQYAGLRLTNAHLTSIYKSFYVADAERSADVFNAIPSFMKSKGYNPVNVEGEDVKEFVADNVKLVVRKNGNQIKVTLSKK